jgi:hypothetical protein
MIENVKNAFHPLGKPVGDDVHDDVILTPLRIAERRCDDDGAEIGNDLIGSAQRKAKNPESDVPRGEKNE